MADDDDNPAPAPARKGPPVKTHGPRTPGDVATRLGSPPGMKNAERLKVSPVKEKTEAEAGLASRPPRSAEDEGARIAEARAEADARDRRAQASREQDLERAAGQMADYERKHLNTVFESASPGPKPENPPGAPVPTTAAPYEGLL